MNDKLDSLLGKLKLLEDELLVEIHANEKQFSYTVQDKKVHFKESAAREHRLLAKKLTHYWRDTRWSSYITTPVILSCIIPVVVMDFWATAYQFNCFFRLWNSQQGAADDYHLGSSQLRYLNSDERLNYLLRLRQRRDCLCPGNRWAHRTALVPHQAHGPAQDDAQPLPAFFGLWRC